jgi:hypothetical protein
MATEDGQALAVGRADVGVRDEPAAADPLAPSAAFRIDAGDVAVPAFLGLPLGDRVGTLGLSGEVLGRLPSGPAAEALARWRDAGGTVEVERLEVDHGPLSLNASGTVALDAALQPVGAFTARIRGFVETVELLRKKGVVRGRDAVTAQLILGALAKKPDDGGPAILSLPLSVQDRRLYVGPVAITRIPPVRWDRVLP